MTTDSPTRPGRDGGTLEPPDVETASDRYARRFAGPVGKWFLEIQGSTALQLLGPLQRGARVLDVGGGHAQLTPYLIEAGFETVVVGSTPACARRLRPWLDTDQIVFEPASLAELPFSARSFDAVLAFRLLAHVESPEELIQELCRVADKTVVVDYASTRSFNLVSRAAFGAKRRVEGDTRPFRTCSPASIRAMFASAHFRVSAVRPQFVVPMAVHRMASSAAISHFAEVIARRVGLTKMFGSPVVVRADRAFSGHATGTGRGAGGEAGPDS